MNNDKEMTVVEWILGGMVIVAALAALFFFFTEVASAAPVEEDSRMSSQIFNAEHTRLPDDSNAYYQIDISGTTEEKENNSAVDNFVEGVTNFNPVKDTGEGMMMRAMNTFMNVALAWNMMMVNLMIGILNFAFETEIIDAWIDRMDGLVQNMAGVSGVNITGGVFGSLLGFATILAGLAAMHQMLVKKAVMGGVQTILKTILVITAAFILFANFAPMMKGMNAISTEISASLLTGTVNMSSGQESTPQEVREEVASHLWINFIGRPYMIMQYGSDNVDAIGQERVNTLLAMKPGEDRQQYVDEIEIGERGNENMTYASTSDRLAFTIVYSVINALVSLPVFGLALAIIIFQLWFLMMAIYAPFALIQAAFPGQFGTLKRYAIELVYPLICKILVTVATLFIFTIGFAVYSIPPAPGSIGIAQYFVTAVLQFGMFGVFFLFRKRIARIISAGSMGPFDGLRQDITGLKQSISTTAGSVTQTAIHVGAAVATGGSSTAITAAAATVAQQRSQAEDQTEQQPQESQPMASMQPEEKPAAKEYAAATVEQESPPMATMENAAQEPDHVADEVTEEPAAPIQETMEVEAAAPISEQPEAPTEAAEPEMAEPLASMYDMEAPVHEINIKNSEVDTGDIPKAESQD